LNRPFDDQHQARVRIESEAVTVILDRCDSGHWRQLSSEVAEIEIGVITDRERRARVQLLLPEEDDILKLSEPLWKRAVVLEKLGFKAADALHVSAAEDSKADVLLSCDDRLCRLGRRHRAKLHVRIANPVDWL
jgi:predicted nucleic acid-binding protein